MTLMFQVLMAQSIGFPIVVLVCYSLVVFHIYVQKRGTSADNAAEKEILRQAILLFAVFEVCQSAIFEVLLKHGIYWSCAACHGTFWALKILLKQRNTVIHIIITVYL